MTDRQTNRQDLSIKSPFQRLNFAPDNVPVETGCAKLPLMSYANWKCCVVKENRPPTDSLIGPINISSCPIGGREFVCNRVITGQRNVFSSMERLRIAHGGHSPKSHCSLRCLSAAGFSRVSGVSSRVVKKLLNCPGSKCDKDKARTRAGWLVG